MAANLIVAPEDELDIAEGYAWYEDKRPGLGDEFLSCVDACIKAITSTPERHVRVHGDYRRGVVRRFPYVVFYRVHGRYGYVYCIFHTSQTPEKWRQRLP